MATKAEVRKRQQLYTRSRKAELAYSRNLREVAKQVSVIVKGFTERGITPNTAQLKKALEDYSNILRPWAESVATRMLSDMERRDSSMWQELSSDIGEALSTELAKAKTGTLLKRRLREQVELITSLPREAAERVHHLTVEGLSKGWRAAQISEEILKTGEVTKSRANLIARTEVARTATELTMARCEQAAVTHYIWRTSGDADVRESHKQLNGKVFAWNDPPEINEGTPESPRMIKHHPGSIWNCRCYAEPIIPEET